MADFKDDEHLDVCQNIEVGLKQEYEENPTLTDLLCINALENACIAIKQEFGYAKNQKVSASPETEGVINWCVSIGLERIGNVNELTLKDFIRRIDKIKKSVRRHSASGSRGYYEFIKNYV